MNLLKVKTLFLDDDYTLQDAMEAIFQQKNFVDYEWFHDPKELFDSMNDNTQVVVIDYILEWHTENGIEIIRKVKEINPICHCILMSNQTNKKVIIDAYDNGVDKYIDKGDPEFVTQLFGEIEKGIKKVHRQFQEFIEILVRMKETEKIIEEARHEITTR
jgi:DNA-binding NtrC family response regulator